jgi:phosphoesterase RecJ-like protein
MISLPEFNLKLQEKIQKAKRIILFLHKSPDPDSIGSNFGFLRYIKEYNPNSEIVILSVDDLSINLKNIIERYSSTLITKIEPANFDFQSGDLSVFIDFAEIHRASRVEGTKLPDFVDLAIIDHHVIPEINSILNFIETQNISASTIVYKLLLEANIKIDKETYIFLILGILGDSGFLRYRDSNFIQSLDIIKKFCETFGTENYFELIAQIEKNMPVEEFLLEGIYLNNLVYDEKNKFAYTSMTLQERQDKEVSLTYSEFINGATVIRNIGEALFSCSITEDKKEKNKFNISLRSSSGSNFVVRDIAVKLGGGGHVSASGAQIEAGSMQEAIERVKSAIHELNELRTTSISG